MVSTVFSSQNIIDCDQISVKIKNISQKKKLLTSYVLHRKIKRELFIMDNDLNQTNGHTTLPEKRHVEDFVFGKVLGEGAYGAV